jgi:apolipoprotein N-acyltransferase
VSTGLALAATFPRPSLWPLAWLALVPLLRAVRAKRVRAAFGLGWIAGFAFYLPVLYWVAPTITNYTRISTPLAAVVLVLLAAVVAVSIASFAAGVEWLAQSGTSRVVSAPALMVAVEWSRTFFPAGFPWALLGYSQAGVLPVIQVADLGGVYLVTAILVFFNACAAELWLVGWRRRPLLLAAAITVPTLTLG